MKKQKADGFSCLASTRINIHFFSVVLGQLSKTLLGFILVMFCGIILPVWIKFKRQNYLLYQILQKNLGIN